MKRFCMLMALALCCFFSINPTASAVIIAQDPILTGTLVTFERWMDSPIEIDGGLDGTGGKVATANIDYTFPNGPSGDFNLFKFEFYGAEFDILNYNTYSTQKIASIYDIIDYRRLPLYVNVGISFPVISFLSSDLNQGLREFLGENIISLTLELSSPLLAYLDTPIELGTLPLSSLDDDTGPVSFGYIYMVRNGNQYDFMLGASVPQPAPAPTPEPGTMFLMGFGLAGLVAVRRFRK